MLRYTADLRTIAFVFTYYLLIALTMTVALPTWAYFPLMVVICFLSFFCAVMTHNTVHVPIFRSRVMNQIFQVLLTPTYGHPVSMFVPGHNLSHHKYMQTPKDRMRTDKMRFRWNLLNQLFFNFAVGPAIFKDNAAYVRLMKEKRPRWYHQFLLELAFYGFFLVGTIAGMIATWGVVAGLIRWVVFVFIPHQYAVWGISGINFVQHDGCDAEHRYNHSRNFTGKLVNWFTFNNGFHGVHHLRPTLHWSLAPEAHEKEMVPNMDPRLNHTALLPFLFKQYIFPGKRVRYDGTPVVLGPERPDEDWVAVLDKQTKADVQAEEAEYGAIA